jgi:hypothetical protein
MSGEPHLDTDDRYRLPDDHGAAEMPSDDMIKRIQGNLSYIVDPHCTGDLPGVAQPVKSGMQFPFPLLSSGSIIRTTNLAAARLYEVQITFGPENGHSAGADDGGRRVCPRGNTNNSSNGGLFQIFRIPSSASGPRKLMYDTATKYNKKTMKVRVMNGAGLTSGWSAPSAYSKPFSPIFRCSEGPHRVRAASRQRGAAPNSLIEQAGTIRVAAFDGLAGV